MDQSMVPLSSPAEVSKPTSSAIILLQGDPEVCVFLSCRASWPPRLPGPAELHWRRRSTAPFDFYFLGKRLKMPEPTKKGRNGDDKDKRAASLDHQKNLHAHLLPVLLVWTFSHTLGFIQLSFRNFLLSIREEQRLHLKVTLPLVLYDWWVSTILTRAAM